MQNYFMQFLLAVSFLAVILSGCANDRAILSTDRGQLAKIDTVIKDEIEKGNFPGAVVLIGQNKNTHYFEAFGNKIIEPKTEEMTKEIIFDLASLTKPVATATSIMILVDQNRLTLDDYVSRYIPAFGCKGKETVKIKHLLSHTSGLPAYTNANTLKKEHGTYCPEKVIEKICSFDALNQPGETFRYSCLGYIILGRIIETVSDKPLDVFAAENIFVPLGMKHTSYTPAKSLKTNIAATEVRDGIATRGQVHDPLASLMGGVSGNAGLFSTAEDLAIYCRMLLNEGKGNRRRILSETSIELLTTTQILTRAYGFDISSSYSWIKGKYASDKTFCHSGYTGTSIVCDPESEVFIIILSNRAHPHDKGSVKTLRTKVANIVFMEESQANND